MKVKRSRRPSAKVKDPAKAQRATGSPDRRQIEIATVGYDTDQAEWPEDTPAWIRWEQGEALVEVTLRDGDKVTARWGVSSLEPISYGQQVVVALPDGEPQSGVIVGVLADSRFREPSTVCGVATGAADAIDRGTVVAAATWQFARLANGRMLAIQTQGADVSIWSGGSVHIRCSTQNLAGAPDGAIHLDGRVALGVGPAAAPIGSYVAPGGEEVEGVSATPAVSVPYTPPTPVAPNTVTPYQGQADGILRARDMMMSTAAIDPQFWAWVTAVSGAAMLPPPYPVSLHVAVSGVGGDGSQHTASG